MYALMKVIAKFSLEELKCIPELLPCTSRPYGWTIPRKRSANVSKPSAMDTTVHKVKLEAKGITCNLFDARAEHLKQLDFNSLRQCQIQLSKVNPMIPFVNSIRNERDVLSTDLKETKYGKYSIFSPLSQQVPIYGEKFNVYCSVDPLIGNEVTNLNQEYPSFPHEDVPIYYDASHHQLKDEELLIYANEESTDCTLVNSKKPSQMLSRKPSPYPHQCQEELLFPRERAFTPTPSFRARIWC